MKNLGRKVRDKVTGFEGIATSEHRYLTGCTQYGIQAPIDKNGNIPEIKYFDEGRLEFLEVVVQKQDVAADENGCDFREHP